MAKPNKKLPERSVAIICTKCRYKLLDYKKGGKGALIKCFITRITADHTNEAGYCPNCHQQFAREAMVRGMPALKIIGNKAVAK